MTGWCPPLSLSVCRHRGRSRTADTSASGTANWSRPISMSFFLAKARTLSCWALVLLPARQTQPSAVETGGQMLVLAGARAGVPGSPSKWATFEEQGR
jgi:hypothetical protein